MRRKKKSIFDEIESRVPQHVKDEIQKSFSIADAIYQGMLSQNLTSAQLAKKTDSTESEVAQWISGAHKFDEETIARIEKVLEKKIST